MDFVWILSRHYVGINFSRFQILISNFHPMSLFSTNKVFFDKGIVPEQLRSARQARGLKLDQVAKLLNIHVKYLHALESGDYQKLPTGVYGQNFLREYVNFLRLDYKKIATQFAQEKSVFSTKKLDPFAVRVVGDKKIVTVSSLAKSGSLILAVAACLLYLFFLLNRIFVPPPLTINSPLDNSKTKTAQIIVSGKTDAEATVFVNTDQAAVDNDGNFSQAVDLKSGLNLITITAFKKNSQKNVVTRRVLFETGNNTNTTN